ncbi:MAG: hypothetical protein IT269_11350 [Saprospiraceae bacterium]|nr:hypothetical protein [Saprospiraceae bacterium]
MKNFLAFYGDAYYPSGGMGDFIGDYYTKEEAVLAIEDEHKKNMPHDIEWQYAWGHVWSSQDKAKVFFK